MDDGDGGQEAHGKRPLRKGRHLHVQRHEHVLAKDDAVARREAQQDGGDGNECRGQEPRALVHELEIDLVATTAGQHAAEFHGHGQAAGCYGGTQDPEGQGEADAADGLVDVSGGGEDAGADDARDGEHVGRGP